MMSYLTESVVAGGALAGKEVTADTGETYTVKLVDDFEYTDPIDKSLTKNQVRGEVEGHRLES